MNETLAIVISISSIFIATTIGSGLVFFFKKNFSNKTSAIIVGLASGIMISTSFFGLLKPALEQAQESYDKIAFLPMVGGFILGCLLLYALDKLVPHIHINKEEHAEGLPSIRTTKRLKFFLAVAMHNIPEGLAVGFACGVLLKGGNQEAMALGVSTALALAIGISIQNIPEGAAVSIPMLEDGVSKPKAFLYGLASGIVEPIFAVIAMFITSAVADMALPWLLSFAAGAMIYVTIDELVPEFKQSSNSHFGIWSFIAGFAIMMMLELLL